MPTYYLIVTAVGFQGRSKQMNDKNKNFLREGKNQNSNLNASLII